MSQPQRRRPEADPVVADGAAAAEGAAAAPAPHELLTDAGVRALAGALGWRLEWLDLENHTEV